MTYKNISRFMLLLVIILGLMVTPNAWATTTVSPALQTQINNDVAQGVVRGFGAVPVQGGDGATISTWITDLQTSAGVQNSSTATELVRETERIASRAGFLSKARFLGTVGLGLTSFSAGWKIGSGINAKFLHFNTPTRNTSPITYTSVYASWEPATSATNCTNVSVPAIYCTYGSYKVYNNIYPDKFYALSQTWPTMNVAPWHNFYECGSTCQLPEATAPSSCCTWIRAVATEDEFWEAVLSGTTQLPVPYTNQTINYDTGMDGITDPGVSATTALVNTQLHSGTNNSCPNDLEVLCAFLNHEADPTNYPNPVTVTLPVINHAETYQHYADRLIADGLKPQPMTMSEYDPDYDAGSPIYTDPLTGSEVRVGDTIKVWRNPSMDGTNSSCTTSIPRLTDPYPNDGWDPPNAAQYAATVRTQPDGLVVQSQYQAVDLAQPGNPWNATLRHGRVKVGFFGPEGWGYRFIWWVRGWDKDTQSRTAAALLTTPVQHQIGPPNDSDYVFDYLSPIYHVSIKGKKLNCAQLVRATYWVTREESSYGLPWKGIIDSKAVVVP